MESKDKYIEKFNNALAAAGCKRISSVTDVAKELNNQLDLNICRILDEYAQQMAIEFAEWEEANKREIESVDGKFYTINIIGRYQIFLNEKQ